MRRWPFVAVAFAGIALVGSCAVWMAHPPPPPDDRPVYTVCHATGLHGGAVECEKSFEPPGAEPGTFAPGQGPAPVAPVSIPPHHGSSTEDTTPQFQGTPDLGPADIGPADHGEADGGEPGTSD